MVKKRLVIIFQRLITTDYSDLATIKHIFLFRELQDQVWYQPYLDNLQ